MRLCSVEGSGMPIRLASTLGMALTMSPRSLTRSEVMSRIRGRDTGPELAIRKRLYAARVRYRVDYRCHGIRADIALPGIRLAVFIDGCFWHGCPLHATKPRNNATFWRKKLAGNAARDRRQTAALVRAGWTVLRFWEHAVETDPEQVVRKIMSSIVRARRPQLN